MPLKDARAFIARLKTKLRIKLSSHLIAGFKSVVVILCWSCHIVIDFPAGHLDFEVIFRLNFTQAQSDCHPVGIL